MRFDKQKESSIFYSLRAYAILSVAYAHSLSLQNVTLSRVGALLGLIGVPVFLICSGYYYKPAQLDKDWFLGKTVNIVAPWLLWGTFAYALSVYLIGPGGWSFFDYILYLFGHKTWLYYVPVYLVIIFFYQVVHPSLRVLFLSIVIALISNSMTYYWLPDVWLTPYQNPLNWIGFYAIGILLKRYMGGVMKNIYFVLFGMFVAGIAFVIVSGDWKVCYWHPLSFVFELFAFGMLLFIAAKTDGEITQLVGKNSYILYFLHMQYGIAITNRLFSILYGRLEIVELLFKPIVVIVVSMTLVLIIQYILTHLGLGKYIKYVGIKL